jgi:hypothetical protein
MDAFPVAPDLMQAFPRGALSLLVTFASTVAAQHGVDPARHICRELAGNDELWGFIAGRVDRRIELVDDAAPDTKRERPWPRESLDFRNRVTRRACLRLVRPRRARWRSTKVAKQRSLRRSPSWLTFLKSRPLVFGVRNPSDVERTRRMGSSDEEPLSGPSRTGGPPRTRPYGRSITV